MPTTAVNLLDAASGEHYEWSSMYKKMAQVAREEGFEDIATRMEGVAKIEAIHEQRYRDLLKDIKNNRIFKRSNSIT
jgi:rubrerythrin